MDIKGIPKQSALLIIDMQKGGFKPTEPKYNTEQVIETINQVAGIFRKNNSPVIFIQHDGSSGNAFVPGTHDWEIIDELIQSAKDIIISKTANSAFYNSSLHQTLQQLNCQNLFITGWATDFCVDSTIRDGLNHEYNAYVIAEGHTCSDRQDISAEAVVRHFNWLWSNLIPTNGGNVTVVSKKVVL